MYWALLIFVVLFGLFTKRVGWRYPLLHMWFGMALMLLVLVSLNVVTGGVLGPHQTQVQFR